VDVDKNGPMIYLPLDQLHKAARGEAAADPGAAAGGAPRAGASASENRSRDRGGR
jgi:hypothetical protein